MAIPSLIPSPLSRRDFIRQSFAAATIGVAPGVADHGLIKPPLPLPQLTVLRNNGASATLQSISAKHVTALQLMFTTCTTTCPMQGAIFERVQKLIPDMAQRSIQLISLSVDPRNDTPQALAQWLAMFHAGPSWIGAAPALKDLAEVKSFFGAGRNLLDPHSTQTHILDRSGRLVFRTFELSPPEQIASILRGVC